ncbi:MAG: carboxypeptidase-like regulatory domain-containing protein [Crocinitomicaceae bacterium]|nr:carboxypeptidase-like regulatory domain-containing protein [Crocinitomicaceae bacterium]
MLLKLKLLVVSLLLTLSYGFSQAGLGTIKGTVSDAETKTPIAFVKVILMRDGQKKGAANTDFDGNFQINSIEAGTYDLFYSNEIEGYQPQELKGVKVNSEKITFLYDLTLAVAADVQALSEVVVVAYRVPLIDRNGGASGATVTREDIARLPVRSAAGVAGTVGGVNTNEGSGAISVRGSRSEGTYFYIDGIKVRGSASLPKSAIEEVTVITGGLPANYGDATGGIISITTRGPSAKYFGSIEGVTSGFYFNGADPDGYDGNVYGLDKYGYNLVEGMFSGPLWMQRDSTGAKTKPRLGFLLSANYTNRLDSRPFAGGSYRIKKDVRDELLAAPLRPSGSGTGSIYNALYLRSDDFEQVDWRMNARTSAISAQGKIDVNTGPSVNLTFGGSLSYNWGSIYSRTGSLFNFSNFGAYNNLDWRVFGRLIQRFNNNREGSSSKIKSAFYSLMVDYTKTSTRRFDPKHEYNLFNYGHVGTFDIDREKTYALNLENGNYEQSAIPAEARITFTPSSTNPQLAAQTEQFFGFYDYEDYWLDEQNYGNLGQVQAGNGILNGGGPQSVYGVWSNIGSPYNYFQKTENDQFRATGSGAVNIGDHSISIGFEYEQRFDRGWTSGTTTSGGGNGPMGLWTVARQYTNSHISELNTDAGTSYQNLGLTYVDYEPLNTGWASTHGGEYGGQENNDEQTFFDYNLRNYLFEEGELSTGAGGSEYINIDQYDPNIYQMDWFSPDELLNSGNSYVSYWGYDHAGNKTKNDPTDINKYFNEFDENGNYKRYVGAYQPTYIAGYLMDKFAFRDIVFNVGVRVDVFDANQPVLKDKYLIYNARTVAEANEVYANDASKDWLNTIPETMGEEYVVYVNDEFNPNSILGFRNGDTWYDANGIEVEDPKSIEAVSAGGVMPYLKNPGQNSPTADAFEDYKPQVSIMPRVSFSFPISDEASFFAHYDILTKRPTSGVRFDPFQYQFINERSAIVNNSNLRPEKTIDYELGFQQVLSKTSSLKISAFYREQRDNVQLINVTGAYPRQYRTFGNRDFGTVKGVTVSYDMRRTGNIRMTANYTLQFADGTGSDATSAAGLINAGLPNLRAIFPYSFDQRHAFAITFDYRYGEGADYNGPSIKGVNLFENMGLNIVSNIYSGSPYSAQQDISDEGFISPSNGSGLTGTTNGSRLPWSYRLDLQLDRTFNIMVGKKDDKKKATFLNVYLRVTNLFNQFNVLSVYRATGNPDDDGYLEAAQYQTSIANQQDEQAFREFYALKVNNPNNISSPRTIRLGVKFDF